MRYLNVPELDFTNADDITKTLKDIRVPEVSDSYFVVEDFIEALDMLAVRSYGDNGEPLWYHIADQNWKNIVNHKFDISKIKRYEVPIL